MEKHVQATAIKSALKDIYLYIVWGKFANTYFNRSSSWLYNKFNGRDDNGGIGGFSEEEKAHLKKHLLEFAETVMTAAENIK